MKVKWFLPGESFLLYTSCFSRVIRFCPVKTFLPNKVLQDEKVFTENMFSVQNLITRYKLLPFLLSLT